jgi:hypothetical protein
LTGTRVLTRVRLDLTHRIEIPRLRGAEVARAAALAPAAAGGGLAGLGRKRPSGLGFKRGLHGKNAGAMGIASRGSVGQGGGRRGVYNGGARLRSYGEEACVWQGEAKGKNRPARFLTPRQNSGGGSW